MARRRFSLEDESRLLSKWESTVIPYDANMASLINIKDTDRVSDASMSAQILTMIYLLACVVFVQLWTPE